eukprot:EST48292.1 Hypothetical protein SS50377_11491 [Spironucleus salmonicida]
MGGPSTSDEGLAEFQVSCFGTQQIDQHSFEVEASEGAILFAEEDLVEGVDDWSEE